MDLFERDLLAKGQRRMMTRQFSVFRQSFLDLNKVLGQHSQKIKEIYLQPVFEYTNRYSKDNHLFSWKLDANRGKKALIYEMRIDNIEPGLLYVGLNQGTPGKDDDPAAKYHKKDKKADSSNLGKLSIAHV